MSNVPNMDGMDAGDLMKLWGSLSRASRNEAEGIVGDRRKGYTTIVKSLAHYAANKAAAMRCRERGEIQGALTYERICEGIYAEIPEDLRW